MDANEVIKRIQFYNKGQNVEVEFTAIDGAISTSQVHAITCFGDSLVLHGCQNNAGYSHLMERLESLVKNDNEGEDEQEV
jgi:hypothetical protein